MRFFVNIPDTFVASTTLSRTPRSASHSPRTVSEEPDAYASAVSKSVIPRSNAVCA